MSAWVIADTPLGLRTWASPAPWNTTAAATIAPHRAENLRDFINPCLRKYCYYGGLDASAYLRPAVRSGPFWRQYDGRVREARTPPSRAQGAITTIAAAWVQAASLGRAAIETAAPRTMTPARTAAWVVGRRTAMRAVSHPAISAHTAPHMTVASLNATGAASCGSWPESWNIRVANAPKTTYPAATAPMLRSMSRV